MNTNYNKPKANIHQNLKLITTLYPWQKDVEELVTKPLNNTIYWVCDSVGLTGKTSLLNYMHCKYNIPILINATKNKMQQTIKRYIKINDTSPEMMIIKENSHKINTSLYEGLTQLHDGLIPNDNIIFNPFQIVVLSRTIPDFDKISKWKIKIIRIN